MLMGGSRNPFMRFPKNSYLFGSGSWSQSKAPLFADVILMLDDALGANFFILLFFSTVRHGLRLAFLCTSACDESDFRYQSRTV
jgi:hypothetical protein